ncbi:hypothetical protein GFV14_00757 [Candidatus Hartigia pinicola]|nr:hypothetical protein GFV14_00757 [Candidatus Hartigia pinicola]
MAKCRQSLINWSLLPGALASGLLMTVALLVFFSLWFFSPKLSINEIFSDIYIWHVINFTFFQAFLSAFFSIFSAIFLSKALYRRRFPGRMLFLQICAMTFVLPVIVVVFGILSVYGQTGWLSQFFQLFGLNYTFSVYGLPGIVMAHVFFNMPFATRILLQSLEDISIKQRQISSQLGLNEWQKFRILEWPYIRKQMLPTAALIFMLCFVSFSTVLALGGGPATTTIELAIYQALNYDFDPSRATLLSLIQLFFCITLMFLSKKNNTSFLISYSKHNYWCDPADNLFTCLYDSTLIITAILLLIPPLLAIVIDGLNSQVIQVFSHGSFWQATLTSLFIAICASILCIFLTMMLLWSSRELFLRRAIKLSQAIEITGLVILAMPGIVLSTGFFIFFNATIGIPQSPYILLMLTNALLAIPYAIKVLENPMRELAERYNVLCYSLAITGFNRLFMIELKVLKKPISEALAFSCIISIGDFGVVSLFGNEDFYTLPSYLYQQINGYRINDGAVTAMFLLLLCLCLFYFIQSMLSKDHD